MREKSRRGGAQQWMRAVCILFSLVLGICIRNSKVDEVYIQIAS